MSVTAIRWLPNQGYDMHLLRGEKSRRLDEMLVLELSDDTSVMATAPPPRATVRFLPEFAGAPKNHGVTVDMSTGTVEVASTIPSGRPLHNFLIRAVVIEPGASTPIEPVFIRFHIHAKIDALILTPQTLTLRPDAEGLRFTVLADFDDRVLGDITDSRRPGLVWSSSSPKIEVHRETGELKVKDFVEGATISALVFGKTAEASVIVEVPWEVQRGVSFVGGKGDKKWKEATNILFLPEGFKRGERPEFERLVRGIVNELRFGKPMRPFDLLRNAINYWMAFEPSEEAGATVLPECYVRTLPDITNSAGAITLPVEPAKALPATTAWSVPQIIHKIGLPVLGDSGRPLDSGTKALLGDLQRLYGSDITKARLQKFFTTWSEVLSSRALLHEVDTAFGLAQGERPRVAEVTQSHLLAFHPRRTSLKLLFSAALTLETALDNRDVQKVREAFQLHNIQLSPSPSTAILDGETVVEKRWTVVDLKDNRNFSVRKEGLDALKVYRPQTIQHLTRYLEKLRPKGEPEPIGATWTTGKDRGLVCFITRTQRRGGFNVGAWYTASLGTEDEYRIILAKAPNVSDQCFISPMLIPSKPTLPMVGIVAHETAHSKQFGDLGDEYSNFGKLRITERRAKRLKQTGNLQAEEDLLKDPNNAQSGLDGGKIKWNWLRIKVAGVLKAKPEPVGPVDPVTNTHREFEITLEAGHGKAFGELKNKEKVKVFLRRRPLVQNPTLSSPMSLVKVDKDKIRVSLFGGVPGIDPDDYPPGPGPLGSVLLIPAQKKAEPPFMGKELPIVAAFIGDHITKSGRPLRSSKNAQGNCVLARGRFEENHDSRQPAGHQKKPPTVPGLDRRPVGRGRSL